MKSQITPPKFLLTAVTGLGPAERPANVPQSLQEAASSKELDLLDAQLGPSQDTCVLAVVLAENPPLPATCSSNTPKRRVGKFLQAGKGNARAGTGPAAQSIRHAGSDQQTRLKGHESHVRWHRKKPPTRTTQAGHRALLTRDTIPRHGMQVTSMNSPHLQM